MKYSFMKLLTSDLATRLLDLGANGVPTLLVGRVLEDAVEEG